MQLLLQYYIIAYFYLLHLVEVSAYIKSSVMTGFLLAIQITPFVFPTRLDSQVTVILDSYDHRGHGEVVGGNGAEAGSGVTVWVTDVTELYTTPSYWKGMDTAFSEGG